MLDTIFKRYIVCIMIHIYTRYPFMKYRYVFVYTIYIRVCIICTFRHVLSRMHCTMYNPSLYDLHL